MYDFGIILSALVFLVALTLFTWAMIDYATKIAKYVYDKHVAKEIIHLQLWKFKLDVSPHAIPYVFGVFIISLILIWLVDSLIIFSAEHVV